jgi:hypothetical protein
MSNVSRHMKHSSPRQSARSRWLLRALPLLGAAAGPLVAGGAAPFPAKVVAGFCFGLAVSLVGWQGQYMPPISTALAFLAAALLAASVLVVASFGSGVSITLFAVVLGAAALMFWGLVRL